MLETRKPTLIATCSTLLALLVPLLAASHAQAHFKLLSPTSWLTEDNAGAPQKGGPCGPGGLDNVTPIPMSGVIDEFHAGETITVEWTDTVAHPGHFRIALAENRDDLVDPDIVQDGSCSYNEMMVPTGAHGNVLADGVEFRSRTGFTAAAGHMFSHEVTLPNTPCDKCTLQVMQIMENDLQVLSNCYYYHCADIRILPAEGEAGADGGVAGAAGAAGAAGTAGEAGAAGAAGTVGTGGSAGAASTAAGAGAGGAAGTSDVAGTGGVGATPTAGMTGTGATGGTGAGTAAPVAGMSAAGSAAPTSTTTSGCSVENAGLAADHPLFATSIFGVCVSLVALRSRRRR